MATSSFVISGLLIKKVSVLLLFGGHFFELVYDEV